MSANTHLYAGVPVTDLDASIDWYNRFLGRDPDLRADHEALENYSNGVRHVKIPDPDGNAIAFAEAPDAA